MSLHPHPSPPPHPPHTHTEGEQHKERNKYNRSKDQVSTGPRLTFQEDVRDKHPKKEGGLRRAGKLEPSRGRLIHPAPQPVASSGGHPPPRIPSLPRLPVSCGAQASLVLDLLTPQSPCALALPATLWQSQVRLASL
ncbi:hypothetical protein C0Q70_19717 [Pomacea canaliculata]|uniref:Uncharacterized protein n=1 Tax=Pomacea canaliculata TaxID=400727 RepID=A0A2T7NDJ0_POMCA|nr:hypothetical protein C0Q70_19717 [Pomacea canaliculata]